MPRKKGTGFRSLDESQGASQGSSSRRPKISYQARIDAPGGGNPDEGEPSRLPTIQEVDDDGDLYMGADDSNSFDDDDAMDIDDPAVPDPDPAPVSGEEESSSPSDSDESDNAIDAAELRQNTEAAVDATAREAALDPEDVRGAAEYEEDVMLEPEPESVAFDPVDTHELAPESPPSRPFLSAVPQGFDGPVEIDTAEAAANFDPDDPSRLLPSHQNQFIEMSEFETAIATYIELEGVSRKGYERLRQILHVLVDSNGNCLPDVIALPTQLSTLRDRFRKRLPLMHMREADIPLDILKMPTLPPSLKPEERTKFEAYKAKVRAADEEAKNKRGKKAKGKAVAPEKLPDLSMKLTFFDPISIFKNLVASDIFRNAHQGPAHFVDEPTELFQSHAWASSVRASGGIYPHIWIDNKPDPFATILPSDFVYYRCMDEACYCHTIGDDDPNTGDLHLGRIFGFGIEKREGSPTFGIHGLTLQIQEALRPNHRALGKTTTTLATDELVLNSTLTLVHESSVFDFVDIYVDKLFGETHEDPALSRAPRISRTSKPKQPHKKYDEAQSIRIPPRNQNQYYQVRRMLIDGQLIPICHTHPIRAELELEKFGRSLWEDRWDVAKVENGFFPRPDNMSDDDWEQQKESYKWYPIASAALLVFIDGVGIFRNSYRSLLAMYVTLANLNAHERSRPRNILPVVFGPHGSDFGDVIHALKSMQHLDRGLIMEVNGVMTRICAWTMCFTGDMPAQAENSGFKGPRAHKFCRCCYVPKGQLATDPEVLLNFDIVTHGRFHTQTTLMQTMMTDLPNQDIKDSFGVQWGINNPQPPLQLISPALDLVMTRPMDAAHSEYNGLTNLMHILLKDGILKPEAREEYALALRVWKFPPNAKRLQSPLHHLGSYSLSEHAIWSITAPPFLRHWLREKHIKQLFIDNLVTRYPEMGSTVDVVVKTCAAIAKSNSVLMSWSVSKADRENTQQIVYEARKMFNQLSMVAAASMAGSKGPTPAQSRVASPALTERPLDTIVVGHHEVTGTSSGAMQFLNNTLRPNIHVGVHWRAFADEYGLPVNLNVLTGEDLHRLFKTLVYGTNYTNIEKVMLMKVNVQETIRFVLRNAFQHSDPDLTVKLTDLYQKCPDLFDQVLARADRSAIKDDLGLDDFVVDVTDSADEQHRYPTAINAIPTTEYRATRHQINAGQQLPSFPSDPYAEPEFRHHVRLAFEKDYGKPPQHPSTFLRQRIQWSRKFGFTSKSPAALDERFTFSVGDYIQYSRDGDDQLFGHVDHIFLLDHLRDRHIFVVLQPIRPSGRRDHVLGLQVMDKIDEVVVIGITAVQPTKLYMLDVEGVGIVWNDWNLYWL
ncbi:hypothetical protein VMCG_03429 [Cytospora schulzeri]|uniref:Uncharacterized protein n=1 Tax=Cytospora schulzeri TaxID=448051 RepID=A0A423WWS4_9PEZI|nr:hypothetical protein VMCG_03429 [Valsa malicola]